jgi:DUF438 domain-containing protein
MSESWMDTLPVNITVCDVDGKILYMNEGSQATFAKDGGAQLVGKSLFDCHSPASVQKLKEMLASGEKNVYTIQKKGQKKLIYQAPYYEDGKLAGLVEFSFVLPEEMPHFNRDAA